MLANSPVPAVQYLRMSTEHQQYSLENQSTAIHKYAESHGFSLVRTYSDAAKTACEASLGKPLPSGKRATRIFPFALRAPVT